MNNTFNKHLESLQKEINDKQLHLNNLRLLQLTYPDLNISIDRWNKIKYYSNLANENVTNCDIYYSCGCCYDSMIKVSPYIQTQYGRIYSDPSQFLIGEKNCDGPDLQDNNWEQILLDHKIPTLIIDKVKQYFINQTIEYSENVEFKLEPEENLL